MTSPDRISARDLVRVPSLLSLARLPLAGLFALSRGEAKWAIPILLLAAASDVLDGWWARRFGACSATGALVDGVMDKVFVATVAVTLVYVHALGLGAALLLGLRDLGEIALAVALLARGRARMETERRALFFGKATTLFQFGAVLSATLRSTALPAFVVAAATAGLLATAEYWSAERRMRRLPR